MSAPIGPGDYVECVNRKHGAPNRYAHGSRTIELGGIYLVEAVGEWFGDPFLVISGSYSDHPCRGWAAACFRPVYRPKQSLIESLKAPPKQAPTRTPEHA